MGPDRDITLRVYESRLKDVQTSAKVDEALKCSLGVDVEVEGSAVEWEISLIKEDGTVVNKQRTTKKVEWEVEDAELWWSVGEGKPTRYTVKVDLLDNVCTFFRDSLILTDSHINPEPTADGMSLGWVSRG